MKLKKIVLSCLLMVGLGLAFMTLRSSKPYVTDKFCGVYLKATPNLTLNNLHDTTITGKWFYATSNVNCLRINTSHRVKFVNCIFGQVTTLGGNNRGLFISHSDNITVVNCYFENLSAGVYAEFSQTVKVDTCQFKNMKGPFPSGQAIQFNTITGAGNSISYNKAENIPGICNNEDIISVYHSSGLPGSPIRVVGNKLRGGGPGHTGAGVMLGDAGGAWEIAAYNIVVETGAGGVDLSGGHNIQIIGNKVYSRQLPYSNTGVASQNYSGLDTLKTTPLYYDNSTNTVQGNYVNWTAGYAGTGRRDLGVSVTKNWISGVANGGPIGGKYTNITGSASNYINSTILPNQLITTCTPIH